MRGKKGVHKKENKILKIKREKKKKIKKRKGGNKRGKIKIREIKKRRE